MIVNEIKQLISELTGFPENELTAETKLQLDLALDSIKMMGLMSQLVARFEHIRPLTHEELVKWDVIGDVFEHYNVVQDESINEKENYPSDTEFPILNSQRIFFLSHALNAGNGLCTRLKLKGSLDLDIAKKAWQLLVERTPALRTYYVLPDNATSFNEMISYIKHDAKVPEIEVIHLQGDDADEIINQRINKEWKLDQWPLHQFDIGVINEEEFYLYFSNDHVISDGRGNQNIVSEFMGIYDAIIKNTISELSLPITDIEFANTINEINAARDEYNDYDYIEYMKKIGEQPFFWNMKNDEFNPDRSRFKNLFINAGDELTRNLINLTKKYDVSINTLLTGMFIRTLRDFDENLDDVVLQIPTSGILYPIPKIEKMVGCFAQNIPFRTRDIFSSEGFEQQIKNLHEELYWAISQGVDSLQSDVTAKVVKDTVTLHRGQIPSKMIPLIRSFIRSNIYFPYIGRVKLKKHYGQVEVIEYRPTTSNSSGAIDFLQEIYDGQLVMSLNFDAILFDHSMMEQLMKNYHQSLYDLVSKPELQEIDHKTGDFAPSYNVKTQGIPEWDINYFKNKLLDFISENINVKLKDKDAKLHLEADLGLDSLELIRIFNKIAKKYNIKDKLSLFKCRTLEQLADFIIEANSKLNKNTKTQFYTDVEPIPFRHFIRQASLTPEATAVYDKNGRITYRELDESSNQLANYLVSQGVGNGKLVAIHLNRSCEMIIAMLAVLKTGAAYVPIDDKFPTQRVTYILEHAQCDILIANSNVAKQVDDLLLNSSQLNTIIFMEQWTPLLRNRSVSEVSLVSKSVWSEYSILETGIQVNPNDTMIVLYTSGSTGNPKGVELNHLGYMIRMEWHQDLFRLIAGNRVAQKTSCSFDISVWEIYWPLMLGGEVAIVDTDTVKNPWALADWLTKEAINYMHFVPSMLGEFLNAVEGDAPDLSAMKYLVCSGEALPRTFVRQWFHEYGSIPLANLYGPTEASIDVSAYVIDSMPEDNDKSIPIGSEMPGVQLLIIDEHGKRVNPGETGELCIAGPQLAKGYLNDEEKTEQTFIDNIWQDIKSDKVYKTGDLVTCDSSGCYTYKGRLDHQVKIRGYRVELGEIENVLLSHPNLDEVGVITKEINNTQKIICFYAGKETSLSEMTGFAEGKLTSYMLPNYAVHLSSLPKNHNGKLDRKGLSQLSVDFSRQSNSSLQPVSTVNDTKLPLGSAQRWIMNHFDKPYNWFGYHRFTYKQALDLEVFTAALNKLISSHDALRTVIVPGERFHYQEFVDSDNSVNPELFSAEHLTTLERDEQVELKIAELLEEIKIEVFPLWRLLIVKVTDNEFDISIIGHHLISDMISSEIFFRELWRSYGHFLEFEQFLDEPRKTQYGDYVCKISELESAGKLNNHLEYWISTLGSISKKSLIPLECNDGINDQASEEIVSRTFSKEQTASLVMLAKQHYQSSLYSVLACPLYDLIADHLGLDTVVVSHKFNGRGGDIEGINTTNSIGNYAVNVPLVLNWNHNDSWARKVANVENGIAAIPLSGITYDWLGDRLPESCYPDEKLTSVRLNYLGYVTAPKSDVFEFNEKDSHQRISFPQQKRVSEIEFWLSIHEQQLQVRVGYSSNRYHAKTIENLVEEYTTRLLRMINFKSEIKESSLENIMQ